MNKIVKFFVLACLILSPMKSFADTGVLQDCATSPAFQKRLNASVKKLQGRVAKYEAGTPPALALEDQIARTEARFKKYGESDLLCGTDGLPHLIASGDPAHAAEFVIPAFGFLYTTGWIGWVGRKYLLIVSKTKNSTEKEIIIDVPLALKIMSSGFIWPLSAWQEVISGELIASQKDITVSTR